MRFTHLVLGSTLAIAGLTVTGCTKDIQNDLNEIQKEVSALKGRLDALEASIKGGLSIKELTSLENGIRVTLADGTVHDITSGAAGNVYTISEDGFWVENGTKTDKPARGPKGDPGEQGKQGRDGLKYYPNTETGTWWVFDSETDLDDKGKDTGISFGAGKNTEDALTAVFDGSVLTISNVKDAAGLPTTVKIPNLVAAVTDLKILGDTHLVFMTADGVANTFGPEGQQITFNAGKVQITDKVLLQINPLNADVTNNMFALINSKGEQWWQTTIQSVQPYDGALLTDAELRAPSASGLWVAELKNTYSQADFNAHASNGEGNIRYALTVNNTKAADSKRLIASGYDLTFEHQEYTPAASLNFTVMSPEAGDITGTNISRINNRSTVASISTLEAKPELKSGEYSWKSTPKAKPSQEQANAVSADDLTDDNRDSQELYTAFSKVPIEITLDPTIAPYVRALYVTLDKERATAAEVTAWGKHKYAGLNTLVEGTKTTVTITTDADEVKEPIGLRVYAVNYDGTLVSPYGRAFYVKLNTGDIPSSEVENYNVQITALSETGASETSELIDFSFDESDISTNPEGIKHCLFQGGDFQVELCDVNGKRIERFIWSDKPIDISADDIKNIKKLRVSAGLDSWTKYVDDKKYELVVTFFKDSEMKLAKKKIRVTVAKVLPKELPGFSLKTDLIKNSVLQAKVNGERVAALTDLFNLPATVGGIPDAGMPGVTGDDEETEAATNKLSFQKLQWLITTPDGDTITSDITGKVTIPENLLGQTLDSKLQYNFGKISSVSPGENYVVTLKSLKVVFSK